MTSIITFNYTKEANDVSSRVYVPMVTPGAKNYFGIDITELSVEDQSQFAEEMRKIDAVRVAAVEKLMREYDIEHNFRSFVPEKMSDIEVEEI